MWLWIYPYNNVMWEIVIKNTCLINTGIFFYY